MTESPQGLSGWLYSSPISPFRLWRDTPSSIPASDQTLRHPEGRTASTEKGQDDEWSDENLRMWEEEDKLDAELAEWLKAQLGE
jgi:hypothetical protein